MKKVILIIVVTMLTGCGNEDISKSNNELNPNKPIIQERIIVENIETENIETENIETENN